MELMNILYFLGSLLSKIVILTLVIYVSYNIYGYLNKRWRQGFSLITNDGEKNKKMGCCGNH